MGEKPIFANFFKQHLLLSPTGEDALELTSSGTSGQKSRMRYDARSLGAAQYMVERIFAQYGWITPHTPCNYLLLSYEPQTRITLGTSFTDQFLCRFAPANRVVYALRSTGEGHQFDVFGVISALQAFAEEGLPVRILGFPAFLWQALQRMQALCMPDLELAAESRVFLGGGGENPNSTVAISAALKMVCSPPSAEVLSTSVKSLDFAADRMIYWSYAEPRDGGRGTSVVCRSGGRTVAGTLWLGVTLHIHLIEFV